MVKSLKVWLGLLGIVAAGWVSFLSFDVHVSRPYMVHEAKALEGDIQVALQGVRQIVLQGLNARYSDLIVLIAQLQARDETVPPTLLKEKLFLECRIREEETEQKLGCVR